MKTMRSKPSGWWTAAGIAGGALAVLAGRTAWRRRREAAETLNGKVVLITGGSRGLGQLLARLAALEGAKVVICARDAVELDRARLNLIERGADVLAVVCDVTDPDQVEDLVAQAVRHFGGIDVLVNNAGLIQVGPLDDMRLDDFRDAMDVNFWGTVHTTLAVLPSMRARRRGRIVNITSLGGKIAVPHLLPYDCAKFAALGFSEGLRAELRKEGVAVVTVVPGLMRTGSVVSATFKGHAEEEFDWFATLARSRFFAMDVRRAARRIVRAMRSGDGEVVLGWQAKLVRITKEMFPALTARVLELVDSRLPPDGDHVEIASGKAIANARRLRAFGVPVK
jgi:NAD(P)-dependent dehydrogenase (short-subunit alcohol dehydrogenase family)